MVRSLLVQPMRRDARREVPRPLSLVTWRLSNPVKLGGAAFGKKKARRRTVTTLTARSSCVFICAINRAANFACRTFNASVYLTTRSLVLLQCSPNQPPSQQAKQRSQTTYRSLASHRMAANACKATSFKRGFVSSARALANSPVCSL